ncbi:acyl-CoA dehydrogenase family protein [Microbacterium trichothecenolyticum]|uniref:Crotonobetainyl-CoA dehydrogenase n=1 Tax=Microbacterium trichothecenolyticum TaxID=69370 RepID=A0A0M2H7F6_MICTR|nr:acyl-CoA dehydrogenase family protein [Microbacterium trichothecenolyticum]KJL42325.1 Crotonobetainyl-CoA dehydrogenase [Microbacterium trichothecenolyticum]
MNFDIDDEQREFAQHARQFFASAAGPAAARALLEQSGELSPGRDALAEFGFSALTIPEDAGGVGSSLLNLALVAEQAGYQLAGPSLASAARVAVLLEGHPDKLADVASGSLALAVVDGPGNGSALAIDAVSASHFLALEDGDLVFGEGDVVVGDPIDATRGLGRVRIRDAEVLEADVAERWERARLVAATILAAEGLGAAGRAVEMSIDHAKNREAFGRPIGAYQAIKHRIVDSWVAVDQLRSLVWWAAWAADHDPTRFPVAASAAKAYCAEAFDAATETYIHVLGGMGFTWDHEAHLYWRRAKVDRFLLGDESEHLAAVARHVLAEHRE